MSARPGPWELVGLPRDPVPADAWGVREVAHELQRRGEALAETGDLLDRLSRLEGWSGETATAFVEHAADVVDDVRQAGRRYDGAAEALLRYADHVGDARERTAGALRDAESAESTRARFAAAALESQDDPAYAERARLAAADDLALARRRLDDALDDLDAAARAAATGIAAASEGYRDARGLGARGRLEHLREIAMRSFDQVCTAVWGALDDLGAAVSGRRRGVGALVDVLATTGFLVGVVAGFVTGSWVVTFVLGATALLARTSGASATADVEDVARTTSGLAATLGQVVPTSAVAGPDAGAEPHPARSVTVSTDTTSSAWAVRAVSGDATDVMARLAGQEAQQGMHRQVGELLLGPGAPADPFDPTTDVTRAGALGPVLVYG